MDSPFTNLTRPIFKDKLLPLFQSMIRSACVNTGAPESGNEDRNVALLKDFFAAYGLTGQILHKREGRGNLVIRLKGTDPGAPSLAFMGHLDVVPAQKQDWSFDPFMAEIHQGEVWGRGAVDMLCWTATQAVGFAEAYKKHGPFPGDLLFIALSDEEAAGNFGSRFLTQEHWDLVKCDYMVTELGGFFTQNDRGQSAFLTRGEKGIAWLKLSAKGTAGHGSMPYNSNNALIKAAKAALKLANYSPAYTNHEVWESMVNAGVWTSKDRFLLKKGIAAKQVMKRLWNRDPGMAKFLDTAGKISLSPNVLQAGEKINIIADRSDLLVDIRFLPGMSEEDIVGYVQKILGGSLAKEFTYEFQDFFPSNLSPKETPLYQAIRTIFNKAHPDAHLADLFIGQVTDGRYWRTRGTTVYGYTLFDKDLTMTAYGERIHGKDERISLSSLSHGLEFFTQLPFQFWLDKGSL